VTCAVLNYAAARHDEAALTVIQLQPYLTFQMILQSMVALVCMPGFSGSKLTGIALDIAIFTWGCRRVTDFSRIVFDSHSDIRIKYCIKNVVG